MVYTFKETDYTTFLENLDSLSKVSFKIDRSNRGKLEKTTQQVKAWESEIKELLKNSIAPDSSFFEEIVGQNNKSIFDDFRIRLDNQDPFERDIKRLESRIDLVKSNIEAIKEYLEICHPLNGKDIAEVFSTQEKFDFVLEKLNFLAGEKFYSVETILTLNNIDFRNNEPSEIALLLTKKGYASKKEKYQDNHDGIKITVKGSAYIERQLKLKEKAKTRTSTTSKNGDLNKKIDEILDRLTKLNFGQEIIFEELEEMRSLQGKLSKKSWGQLLKGKLIDLAVGQVINKEMASEVFKYLTDTQMNLLK